jgi:hypothetical protein
VESLVPKIFALIVGDLDRCHGLHTVLRSI